MTKEELKKIFEFLINLADIYYGGHIPKKGILSIDNS